MHFVFIAALFVQEGHAQIPCRYDVTVIQAPTCGFGIFPATVATGISPNGRYVVGRYQQCEKAFRDEAFVYDTETAVFMRLPRPAGTTSAVASDVNDAGWIVGSYAKTGFGSRGFVYKLHENEWIELEPLPGGAWSGASAINSSGQVCGFRSIGSKGDPVNPFSAFIWSEKEGFTDLGLINKQGTTANDINENGIVTGTMVVNEMNAGFVWKNSDVTDIGSLAGLNTVPLAINNEIAVTGGSRLPPPTGPKGTFHAFLWQDGEMTDLGTLSGQSPEHNRSSGHDINDHNTVIGLSHTQSMTNLHGTIWWHGIAVELNDRIAGESQLFIRTPAALNNFGIVVGTARDPQGDTVAVVLTPDPLFASDLDGNCVVNVNDLRMVILEWGKVNSIADVNRDGIVNRQDLQLVINDWTIKK